MDEIEFTEYTVTCVTQDCQNSNIAITLPAPAIDPFFICGACNLQIKNIAST